jgi:hypothetical protein
MNFVTLPQFNPTSNKNNVDVGSGRNEASANVQNIKSQTLHFEEDNSRILAFKSLKHFLIAFLFQLTVPGVSFQI